MTIYLFKQSEICLETEVLLYRLEWEMSNLHRNRMLLIWLIFHEKYELQKAVIKINTMPLTLLRVAFCQTNF